MSEKTIGVRVNGEDREVRAGLSVADLLEELEIDRRRVVVELNRQIVRRDEVGEIDLEDGDQVEIVQFVGGGRPADRRRERGGPTREG